jgi:hypothetical protein
MDYRGPVLGQMAGSCEQSNEPSDCIKCREFLDWLRSCEVLKKNSAAWS